MLYREDWNVDTLANTLRPGPEHEPVDLGTVAAMASNLLSGRLVLLERRGENYRVHGLVDEQTLRTYDVPAGDLETDAGEALTVAENAWARVCEENEDREQGGRGDV